jgi:hypothetical protein
MSQGVVDVFESIQIQEQHRNLLIGALGHDDRLANSIVQQHSIGQPGQKIVLSRMNDLQRHGAGSTHVSKHDDRADGLPFAVMDRSDGPLYGKRFAVTPNQDAV